MRQLTIFILLVLCSGFVFGQDSAEIKGKYYPSTRAWNLYAKEDAKIQDAVFLRVARDGDQGYFSITVRSKQGYEACDSCTIRLEDHTEIHLNNVVVRERDHPGIDSIDTRSRIVFRLAKNEITLLAKSRIYVVTFYMKKFGLTSNPMSSHFVENTMRYSALRSAWVNHETALEIAKLFDVK